MHNLLWLSSGSTRGTTGCPQEGDLWAQRLLSCLLVTFPQSGIWEMKHLLLGIKAGLIYFGKKGEGEE